MKTFRIKMLSTIYNEDMSIAWKKGQTYIITKNKIIHSETGEELYHLYSNGIEKICIPANEIGTLFKIL